MPMSDTADAHSIDAERRKLIQQETEQAENTSDDEITEIPEEIKVEYKQLMNLIRGNNRLEQQLTARRKGLDLSVVLLLRLDMFIEHQMGSTHEDPSRLKFEKDFAERMRSMLTEAIIQR